jgi:8-oxo-dGTP pyrophosphatase MutT (NUDIX family)
MATAYKPCTYRVSAKAVIQSPKGLLLVKEDSDHWDLPGGGVEHFEEPEQAVHREIQEEVGVSIASIDKKQLQAWATYDHAAERPLLFLVFPVRIKTDAVKSPDPDITIGYFTKQDLKTLPIEPHIEKYRQNLIEFAPETTA